jgi:hypothetical protein
MIDTTRIRVLGTAVAAIGLLALASTALAGSLPRPVDPAIKVNESLGGVSIGQDVTDAEAAWVVAAKCKDQADVRICNYGTRRQGTALIAANQGAVEIASIMAPLKHGEFVFNGPLMKFGTAKGDLGLGDKLASVAKRYPGARDTGRSLEFSDGDTRMTFFASDADTGRITQIGLVKRHLDRQRPTR